MLNIVTARHSSFVKDEIFDVVCPENGLSPNEQIEWLDNHIHDNIKVLTYSPYILNALNVHLMWGSIKEDDLKVTLFTSTDKNNLLAHDENGFCIVDTYDFSEPMSILLYRFESLSQEKIMEQQKWILQEEKDIYQEAVYDWTPTYYEVVLKDGTTANVMSFMDEDSSGGCHEHLIFAQGKCDDYDTNDIVKWRKN